MRVPPQPRGRAPSAVPMEAPLSAKPVRSLVQLTLRPPFLLVVNLVILVRYLVYSLLLEPVLRRIRRVPPVLRTPDASFDGVAAEGFPYTPRYVEIDGMRVHYIDEGASGAPDQITVLCLHGVFTWSFLYRKMVPALVGAGARVVALDFIGCGRSDKFTETRKYTHALHMRTLEGFFEALSLDRVVMAVHDWGGIVGLSCLPTLKDRVVGLVLHNHALFGAMYPKRLITLVGLFSWVTTVRLLGRWNKASWMVRVASSRGAISPAVARCYDAPYPTPDHRAGFVWPLMLPVVPGMAHEVTRFTVPAGKFLETWEKPTLVLFSEDDEGLTEFAEHYHRVVPGARAYPLELLPDMVHYPQEEGGEILGARVATFLHDAFGVRPAAGGPR